MMSVRGSDPKAPLLQLMKISAMLPIVSALCPVASSNICRRLGQEGGV